MDRYRRTNSGVVMFAFWLQPLRPQPKLLSVQTLQRSPKRTGPRRRVWNCFGSKHVIDVRLHLFANQLLLTPLRPAQELGTQRMLAAEAARRRGDEEAVESGQNMSKPWYFR